MARKKKSVINGKPVSIYHNGKEYKGFIEDRKLKITDIQTARGQRLIIGVFDLDARLWHNDDKLPAGVKIKVEAGQYA